LYIDHYVEMINKINELFGSSDNILQNIVGVRKNMEVYSLNGVFLSVISCK